MSLGDIVALHRSGDQPEPLSIIADLEKAFYNRPADYRAEGWHPSQLMDMCPRLEVFKQLMPDVIVGSDKPDPRLQMIFDVGTALHSWWQEQYFGPMGTLKGIWRCSKCGFRTSTMTTMPAYPHSCDKGDSVSGVPVVDASDMRRKIRVGANRYWKFDEVPVVDKDWGIVGHSDGIYIFGRGQTSEEVVLDIKTAGPSFWTRGGIPYPENVFQLNIYMWLLGKTKGILLYIDKGGFEKSLPMMCKEVMVSYNDSYRRDACTKIDLYRDAAKNKELPPRMAMCELKPKSAKPSRCPYSRLCLNDSKSSKIEKLWGDVKFR